MSESGYPNNSSKTRKQYRWLVFDAVGTLIQPDPPVAIAYHSIATKYGSSLTVSEVGDRFRKAFRQSEIGSFPDGPAAATPWLSSDSIEFARWKWIVEQVISDVTSIEPCFQEIWNHFACPSSWSCFEDVEARLSAFRDAGYRLAIASNFDSRLHSVCAGHPPLDAIEYRFVSSETGFRKPASEFYSRLISHCGSPACEILMIGDDPNHDVAGPLAAGMRALLLDRKLTSPVPGAIRSLNQLEL